MPDILTREQVAECRERAERATEGPWEAKCSGHDYPYIVAHGKQLACGEDFGKMPDAEFIAHARTDIPVLCATVEALRVENERLRNVLTFVACGYACVHYPDQDRDHSGIQYPDCVAPDIECCVADALRAKELSR